jgi:hypothetical protein
MKVIKIIFQELGNNNRKEKSVSFYLFNKQVVEFHCHFSTLCYKHKSNTWFEKLNPFIVNIYERNFQLSLDDLMEIESFS